MLPERARTTGPGPECPVLGGESLLLPEELEERGLDAELREEPPACCAFSLKSVTGPGASKAAVCRPLAGCPLFLGP